MTYKRTGTDLIIFHVGLGGDETRVLAKGLATRGDCIGPRVLESHITETVSFGGRVRGTKERSLR